MNNYEKLNKQTQIMLMKIIIYYTNIIITPI